MGNSVKLSRSQYNFVSNGNLIQVHYKCAHFTCVDDLMSWLKIFSLPLEVISSCVDTLVRFARSDNTQDTLVRSYHCQLCFNKRCHLYSNTFCVCVCFRSSWIVSVGSWSLCVRVICLGSFYKRRELKTSMKTCWYRSSFH